VGVRIFQKLINRTDLWWVAFISFGFIVGIHMCISNVFIEPFIFGRLLLQHFTNANTSFANRFGNNALSRNANFHTCTLEK
jgi:hypothetical protein